ncbi:MAG: sulfotransferase domain-containing protein, partial [Thiohalophilus sp.]
KIGKDHFFSVCYEDLTSRPREVVADLSQFLGIDFKEEMLAFHQSNEAQNAASSSSLWQNVVQPIISSNSKKFMKEMSEHDIRIVESIAGDVMDRLGYERVYVQPGEETRFNKTDISRFHDINQEQIKAMSHKTDPEDLKRRQKQASIIEEIRSLAS